MGALQNFFTKFDDLMGGLGKVIEDEVEEITKKMDESSSCKNINISTGDGVSIINKNGNVKIKGKVKTLEINGIKINFE